jgi:hypothetical protein
LAFGIAYLDPYYIRGANGLSGIGDLPITAGLLVHFPPTVILLHRGELLLPPQPATARDNKRVSANHPIFSMTSPFAETVNEIDRPCPQLDDWR